METCTFSYVRERVIVQNITSLSSIKILVNVSFLNSRNPNISPRDRSTPQNAYKQITGKLCYSSCRLIPFTDELCFLYSRGCLDAMETLGEIRDGLRINTSLTRTSHSILKALHVRTRACDLNFKQTRNQLHSSLQIQSYS